MKLKIFTFVLLAAGTLRCFSQGFVNLNFEQAGFVSDPSSGDYPYSVYASNAIPGWTAYVAGNPVSEILSNNISLSGGAVSIIGTNWVYPPIQGKYFILLEGLNYPGYQNTAGIGQTGEVPAGSLSVIFWGELNGGSVSFDGQALDVSQTGSTTNYDIYAANVSAFAGQTGQLLFTTPLSGIMEIDNIQFSSIPAPEPRIWALTALGGLLLARHRCRKPLTFYIIKLFSAV